MTRDSCLLVAILFLAPPTAAAQTEYRLEELRTWGGTEADTVLGNLVGLAGVRDDGTFLVPLPDLGRLVLGSLRSDSMTTIGRPGAGPGEFQRPVAAGWIGDSAWVWDLGTRRLTWLTASGGLLRSEVSTRRGQATPLSDGQWIVQPGVPLGDSTRTVELLGRGRSRARTIATLSWPRVGRFQIETGAGSVVGVQPFAARAAALVDGERNELVTVEPRSGPGRVLVRWRRFDGSVAASARVALPTQAITDELFDAAVRERRQGPLLAVPLEDLRRAIARPRTLAAFRMALLSAEGLLWLRAGPESTSEATWLAVDRRGRLAGRFRAPASLRILYLGGGRLFGARTDPDGVLRLVSYDMEDGS